MPPYQPPPYRTPPSPPSYNPNIDRPLHFTEGGSYLTGCGCLDVLIMLAVVIAVIAACTFLAQLF